MDGCPEEEPSTNGGIGQVGSIAVTSECAALAEQAFQLACSFDSVVTGDNRYNLVQSQHTWLLCANTQSRDGVTPLCCCPGGAWFVCMPAQQCDASGAVLVGVPLELLVFCVWCRFVTSALAAETVYRTLPVTSGDRGNDITRQEIIGAVAGFLLGLTLIVVLVAFSVRRFRKRKLEAFTNVTTIQVPETHPSPEWTLEEGVRVT
jgi:hypothetical protein